MNLTERIESTILSNLQPAEERKIGVECECFFYDKDQRRIPVNPGDRFSSTDLLNELMDLQSRDKITDSMRSVRFIVLRGYGICFTFCE